MKKRFIALFMVLMMMLQLAPAAVLSEGVPEGTPAPTEVPYSGGIGSNVVSGEDYAKVTFTAYDGTELSVLNVKIGQPIGELPEVPAREGCNIIGWKTEAGEKVTKDTVVNADMKVIASYFNYAYPSLKAEYHDAKMDLLIQVPEGALPADIMPMLRGATLTDAQKEAIASAMNSDSSEIGAVDISFRHMPTRQFVQPLIPVNVSITLKNKPVEPVSVVHLSDDGQAEVVASGITEQAFGFETKSFSVYAVVGGVTVAADDTTKRITIKYEAGEHGSVSLAEEDVYLSASAPSAHGSTATANQGYMFTKWTYGEQDVYDKAVFVPTVQKLEEIGEQEPIGDTVTFTANFTECYNVTFLNRDNEVHQVVQVPRGQAIGTKLLPVIAREDYIAYWAVGIEEEGGTQGKEWRPGERITAEYVPTQDVTIIPDYSPVTHTVTFYKTDAQEEVLVTKSVTADTSYCLNEIPDVPEKDGYTGKWVYSGGDFNNSVVITDGMKVWPEYEKNLFTVTYKVGDSTFETDFYFSGDSLVLPPEPVVEGKDFLGWYTETGTEYEGNEKVTSDLTLNARFSDQHIVKFVVLDESSGEEVERLSQYFRSTGEQLTTLPQDPFKSGKVFEKWVNDDTGEEVTPETIVTGPMTVVAVFRPITVYLITAEYYYLNDLGAEVNFDTEIYDVETHELPYTITAPPTTQTDDSQVSGGPIYYPLTPTVTVNEDDFNTDHETTVRVQYVAYTAEYDYVYMLKNLDGQGYAEITGLREHVYGVLNSNVTPTIKNIEYAVLESAATQTIEQASGQELPVYYSRKNFQLTYETNGGSYVGGGTYTYGTSVNLPPENPVREGYDFAGWYSDPELTQQVTGSVAIEKDTTLYAKWTGKTVNYTIVYMKEKYDNATNTTSYVYDNSRTASGQVGSTVDASSAPDMTGDDYRGYERDTAWDRTSHVTIAADGSSVLVVHYDLIRYTLVFDLNNTSGRIKINGRTYTDSNYRIENVVLGQDVSSMWPATSDEVYDPDTHYYWMLYNYYFDGWIGAGSTYITKRYELIWDNVANANSNHVMTFTATWDTESANRNAEYWLEQPDGTWAVADEYTQIGLNTENLGPKNIDGYTKHNGDATAPAGYLDSGNTITAVTQNNNGKYVRDDDKTGGNNRTYYEFNGHLYRERRNKGDGSLTRYNVTFKYTYRFYYDRAKYNIEYFFGDTKLKTVNNVYFDADISGNDSSGTPYNYVPDKPASTASKDYSDYTWGGWYAEAALQNPYTFDKMPGHNLAVYARWIPPTFTVNFVMDGGTPAAVAQTVEKYQKVEKPENPTKAGYIFDNWYTSADGNTLFDWNTQIKANTTIYAHWIPKTLDYTVHYVDAEDSSHKLVPDKVVSDPNFVVGTQIEEQAVAVAGYRPDASSQSIRLNDTGNEITFVYSKKEHETTYTVKYILDPDEYPGEIKVADTKAVTVSGDKASVIELAAAVDYEALYAVHPELDGVEFFPDAVEKVHVLSGSENEIVFKYSPYKHATIKVHYVDMNGNPIPNVISHEEKLKVGKTFTLARLAINGWELNKAVEGTDYSDPAAQNQYKITEDVTTGELVFTLYYQRKAIVTAVSSSKSYDGTPLYQPDSLNDQIKVEGLMDGDSIGSVKYTYANADSTDSKGRLNAGTATVTPHSAVISGAHAGNPNYYKFHYVSGTLDVNKINVTVRIEPDRWTNIPYDGQVKKAGFTNSTKATADKYVLISHEGYKTEYLDDIWNKIISLDNVKYDPNTPGMHYYVKAEKDAGTYNYTLALTEADLPDDPNYSVKLFVRDGRLHILPKEVTVTTGSDSKSYDGKPLTKDEATIDELVDADKEKVTVTATGSQTEVGKRDNTYSIEWGEVNPDNYRITKNLGTLEVTPATLTITIKDRTEPYNGETQYGYDAPESETGTSAATIERDEYTVEGLAEGHVLNISGYTPSSGKDVGTYENGSFDNATIQIMDGETDVTNNYIVYRNPGKLTITKVTLTVTKKVEGEGAEKNKAFTFTLNVADGADASYSWTKTPATSGTNTRIANGGTFTLKDGEKITIDVPAGKEITLTESDNANYNVNWSGDDATSSTSELKITITKDKPEPEVTVTNTRKQATVHVQKTFTYDPAYSAITYHLPGEYQIDYSYKKEDGTTRSFTPLTLNRPEDTFHGTYNDDWHITVPVGVELTFTESKYYIANYNVTPTVTPGSITQTGSGESATATTKYTVTDNNDQTVAITNTYQRKTAGITVKKTFIGLKNPKSVLTNYKIIYIDPVDGRNTLELPSETPQPDSDGKIIYTWTITGAWVGEEYTFTETGYQNDDYKVTTDPEIDDDRNVKIALTVDESNEKNKVNFTNTYELGSITIKKAVKDDKEATLTDGNDKEFTFKIIDENTQTQYGDLVKVNGNGENGTTVTNIPFGIYTIAEVAETIPKIDGYLFTSNTIDYGDPEWTYVDLNKETQQNATVTVTNTYTKVVDLTLQKFVTGNLGDPNEYFNFTVKLTGITKAQSDLIELVKGTEEPKKMTWTETSKTATATIQLKHGETYNLTNLPVGASMTITENLEAGSIYHTYVGTEKKEGEITDSTTTWTGSVHDTTEEKNIAFTNYANIVIPTGIALDSAPYLFLMAIALLGVGLMIQRRRKENG